MHLDRPDNFNERERERGFILEKENNPRNSISLQEGCLLGKISALYIFFSRQILKDWNDHFIELFLLLTKVVKTKGY